MLLIHDSNTRLTNYNYAGVHTYASVTCEQTQIPLPIPEPVILLSGMSTAGLPLSGGDKGSTYHDDAAGL